MLLFTFVSRYYLKTDAYDFWYGAAGGVGIMLAIIGRIKRPA